MTYYKPFSFLMGISKWPFWGMVTKGRQGSPRVSKVPGGPQGWVRWVLTRSIIFKSFSYTIFKIGQFPHWNPYVKRKWLVICHFLVYKSENCFLGSLYHLASCVKGGSDSETKSLIWSRLMCSCVPWLRSYMFVYRECQCIYEVVFYDLCYDQSWTSLGELLCSGITCSRCLL